MGGGPSLSVRDASWGSTKQWGCGCKHAMKNATYHYLSFFSITLSSLWVGGFIVWHHLHITKQSMERNRACFRRLTIKSEYVKVQVFYSLISNPETYHRTLHFTPCVTGPVHSCVISTPRGAHSPAAVSAHWTYRTHCYLCPTRYSFSPESSEAFEGEVSCRRTQHPNYVPRLRGEKHDISLKILHQAGFETARQATTSAKRHALTIAPRPSLRVFSKHEALIQCCFNP